MHNFVFFIIPLKYGLYRVMFHRQKDINENINGDANRAALQVPPFYTESSYFFYIESSQRLFVHAFINGFRPLNIFFNALILHAWVTCTCRWAEIQNNEYARENNIIYCLQYAKSWDNKNFGYAYIVCCALYCCKVKYSYIHRACLFCWKIESHQPSPSRVKRTGNNDE